jgi:ABC-2 type transport system permease protein
MKKIWVVARKDMLEAIRSRSTYLYIAILFFLTFTYISNYNALINSLTQQNASLQTIRTASGIFLNSLAYTLPLMYAFLISGIFAAYSVIVDKSKRNLESLMATPISLKQLWLGKTLGVTLPSVVIALIVSLIGYVAMNFGLIIPHTGSFVFLSPVAIITVLILIPILIFTISALVIYMQLIISNPRVANFAFTAIFLLIFFIMTFLTQQGIETNFGLIYLGVTVVCGGAAYFLSKSLTRERVLLSSRS